MSERTVVAVVSDLIRTGLTVEQQILVNELAIIAGTRERERRRKRNLPPVPEGSEQRKEPKENNIYNISPLEGECEGKPLSPALNDSFDEFWKVYPRRIGRGAARKAYRNALRRATSAEIIAGAERYATSKPDPQFTKHASTWLNADCWLDEPDKPRSSVTKGPWKLLPPESPRPKITEEERLANLEKLAKFRLRKM